MTYPAVQPTFHSSRARPTPERRTGHPLTFLLALVVATAPIAAATYHVKPAAQGGSNGNPGTLAQPWATLQHAANHVDPGDTVLVWGGSYAGFQLETSGTAGQRITFRAAPGETVVIDQDRPGGIDGINLEGASHVTIQGFRVANRTRTGIRAVLCDHVTIRGNVLEANGTWGVLTGCCDDLLIEGNVASGSIVEHGIYVSNSGDRPIIRGNLIVGNDDNGIHMNGDLSIDCDGTTPQDGVISHALVEGNTIVDNGGGGSGINCDGVQDSVIRNNLVDSTNASGISLYQIDGGAPSHRNRVLGNTVLVDSIGRWALNVQSGSTGTVVRNNVFWSAHSFRGAMDVCAACLEGFDSNHNAVENRFTLDGGSSVLTLAQWRAATGQDLDSFTIADAAALAALFVDLAAGDFHLAAGSAALDAGAAVGDLPLDLEGSPRPQGGGWDVGAFEGDGVIFVDGLDAGSSVRWSPSP
jgi:parallel beta-helix repeat protein